MTMLVRPPAPVLAPFVASLGYYTADRPAAREIRVPDGCMQLVINLAADRTRWYDGPGYAHEHTARGAVLCGALPRPVGLNTADQRAVICVAFRPGGARPFFAPPAGALDVPALDLDTLWGRAGATLRERVLHTSCPQAALDVVQETLLARAAQLPRPGAPLGEAIAALRGGTPVAQVSDRLGVARRRLLRDFTDQVGLSPKRFARLQRMQRVLGFVAGADPDDWAETAVRFGFYDQAHLINDFRALTGTTPGRYQARSAAERNHVSW